jgi:hypothetical protein
MKIRMIKSWVGWDAGMEYEVGIGVGEILVRDGRAVVVTEADKSTNIDPIERTKSNKRAKITNAKDA